MIPNRINYDLLCIACRHQTNPDIPHGTMIFDEENYQNKGRFFLESVCKDTLANKECLTCGEKGKYVVLSIWTDEKSKQIRLQVVENNGHTDISLLDENNKSLNQKLEDLPTHHPLKKLLDRAIQTIESFDFNSSSNYNPQFYRKHLYEKPEYACIYYEEYPQLNEGELGQLIHTENNYRDLNLRLNGVLRWIKDTKLN